MNEEMDINNALWSQGISDTDSGFFVIDNSPSRYSRTPVQVIVLSLMNSTPFKTIIKHKEGDGTSPSFIVKKSKEWLCVEGNFLEKDDAERLRIFRYLTRIDNKRTAYKTLSEYAQMMGCTVNSNDLNKLKKIGNSHFGLLIINKIVICITTLIVIVAMICLLWYLLPLLKDK